MNTKFCTYSKAGLQVKLVCCYVYKLCVNLKLINQTYKASLLCSIYNVILYYIIFKKYDEKKNGKLKPRIDHKI